MSGRLVPRIIRIAPLGAALIFALGVLHAARADEPSRISSMSIDKLKGVYLGCEQAAKSGRLNGGDVMYCSLVYEELKEKAFEGEFRRIKSWLDLRSMPVG
ncbi:MAG: hypothetical protein WDZ83_02685 [Rhizobiaceae bacterium]